MESNRKIDLKSLSNQQRLTRLSQIRRFLIARQRIPTERQKVLVKQLKRNFEELRSILSEFQYEECSATKNQPRNPPSEAISDPRTFCTACKLQFSTTSNYTRHLKSCKHIEAMKDSSMQLVQTGPFSFEWRDAKRGSNGSIESENSLKPTTSGSSTSSGVSSGLSDESPQLDDWESLVKSFKYPIIESSPQQNAQESNAPKSKLSPNASRFSIESLLKQAEPKTASYQLPLPSNAYVEKKSSKIQLDDGKRLFRCHYCPKVFANNSNWRRHENLHGRGGVQECPICAKKFMQKEYLKKHLVTHGRAADGVVI